MTSFIQPKSNCGTLSRKILQCVEASSIILDDSSNGGFVYRWFGDTELANKLCGAGRPVLEAMAAGVVVASAHALWALQHPSS